MKVDGQCHCGAFAYEAEAQPGAVGVCHCADCQTLTGSAFRSTVQVPAASFRLLRGQPRLYLKTADSGQQREHAFCGDCGTPVFARAPQNPQTYSLRLGGLAQRAELGAPVRQIWTKRRLPWVCDLAEVAGHEGQP
jgi:hypothetical protein